LLLELGVPMSAITVAQGQAQHTYDELQLASRSIPNTDAPVILVTSKPHTRRVALTWKIVTRASRQGIVRAATQDQFDAGTWWRTPDWRRSAVHEFGGLAALAVEPLYLPVARTIAS
jgi:hypothetical protein